MKYKGKHGEFYLYSEGVDECMIHVYLGDKNDPESEYILGVHEYYLDSLIAVLSLAKQVLHR